jgi:hypothetical protein
MIIYMSTNIESWRIGYGLSFELRTQSNAESDHLFVTSFLRDRGSAFSSQFPTLGLAAYPTPVRAYAVLLLQVELRPTTGHDLVFACSFCLFFSFFAFFSAFFWISSGVWCFLCFFDGISIPSCPFTSACFRFSGLEARCSPFGTPSPAGRFARASSSLSEIPNVTGV